MFDKKRYLRNIGFNWGAFAVSVAAGFLLSPFIVRNLGDAGYGYWSLVATAIAYFGYLDLGIQSGVGHYITRHLADRDSARMEQKVNSALTALGVIGALVFLLACLSALVFPRFFRVGPESVAPLRAALLLLGAVAGVKFPLSVFQAMLVGAQRFDIVGGAAMVSKLANAGLVVLAFRLHHGVAGLACAVAATQLLEALALMAIARRIIPGVAFRPFVFHRHAFGQLFHYGAYNFIINLMGQFGAGFGTFLIGRRLAAEAITYYSIGSELLPYMAGLVSAVTVPLLQIVIPLDVRGDFEAMRELLLTGTRYLFALVCLIGLNLLLVGHTFLGQWMGTKYLDPHPYGSSGTVLSILTLANMAGLSSSVAQQILFGRRKNRLFAAFTFAETAVMALLALLLVPRYGILGVALATLLPMAIVEGLALPFLAGRQVGTGLWPYWRRGILPNLAVAALVIGVCRPVLPLLAHRGWATVFFSFSLVSTVHLAAVGLLLVEKEHRVQLVRLISERSAWGMRAG